MGAGFEEIDRQQTPLGELTVRRRLEPSLQVDVFEVKLGDEFLMSSLFTVAEVALATLSLAEVTATSLDVLVGGLGLGYTARAVLDDDRVETLAVAEALDPVIGWHEAGHLPLSASLTEDRRCHFVAADFFATLDAGVPFGPGLPTRWHAVLVDIDHAPDHLLHPRHGSFYTETGLRTLVEQLHPHGVFGLWADGAPDDAFVRLVERVFVSCDANVVTFPNFYTGEESSSTVYVAQRSSSGS